MYARNATSRRSSESDRARHRGEERRNRPDQTNGILFPPIEAFRRPCHRPRRQTFCCQGGARRSVGQIRASADGPPRWRRGGRPGTLRGASLCRHESRRGFRYGSFAGQSLRGAGRSSANRADIPRAALIRSSIVIRRIRSISALSEAAWLALGRRRGNDASGSMPPALRRKRGKTMGEAPRCPSSIGPQSQPWKSRKQPTARRRPGVEGWGI